MSARSHYYVTTPIYYVNGKPHIGHAYTTVAADAIARYQRLKGREVFFLTGTDEHGQKVLEAATKRGMTPQEHCDDLVRHWQATFERLNISNDRFMRTTDADHVAAVTAVLSHLWERDLIYRDTYEGWYSASEERFWTEKDLVDGKCPLSGNPVVKLKETNYFFRMGRYQQQLIDHIEANDGFVRPTSRRNEVLGFLRRELEDLCISRPKSRMSWGIELPFDADYVCYVWFDALLNYLTGVGYTPGAEGDWQQWWPADVQLIGKDILTTHSVYWTTMLMAMGVPLPSTLYAHGWWTSTGGDKIGKSKGNAIDVDLLCEEFGVDATRYFFLREIAFGADGGFSYQGFLTRYNADLANDLGNLAHRALSMTKNWLGGTVPAAVRTEREAELAELARETVAAFDGAFEQWQFHSALGALWELVKAGNKYIDDTQPWGLNKRGEVERLATVQRTVLEICNVVGCLMRAVMPERGAELLRRLGRDAAAADRDTRAMLAGEAAWLDLLEPGTDLDVADPLFPRHRKMPAAIAALFEDVSPAPAPKKKKAKKKKKKGPPEPPAEITYDDFAKVALRAGTVLTAERHPDADRLLVLTVDVGEPAPRQIVAGIATRFEPEDLPGRKVVVVTNLAPATIRGVESRGMLLAAGGKAVVDLVAVDAAPGEIVR